MIRDILHLGNRIYDRHNKRELHRLIVFTGRASCHWPELRRLYHWFEEDELRRQVLAKNPFPIEQATRAFFYNRSTLKERVQLIKDHYAFMEKKLQPEWFVKLSYDGEYNVWKSADEDIDWHAFLKFEPGQRKEGLLSLEMSLGREHLYQMMFWFGKNKAGEDSLFIGAMQGPNMENAKDIIKDITKRSFRYRTKNLILYMTMAVARAFDVKHIYAVSNEGYYANNHVRRDRKLKTNFGEFWEEAGGHPTEDSRFYEIPLVEPRKTMEEVPTRKRATYRKRFAFLDQVDADIETAVKKILR